MTPLRISVNDSRLKARIRKLQTKLTARAFEPEIRQFTKNTLEAAVRLTPVRSLSVIRSNQAKQYDHRINYIPSYHEEIDPTLIVRDGVHWLKYQGRWYKANVWNLSDDVWSVYQYLLRERDRRMTTRIAGFIERRAQARFLYARSWIQCGSSVGINISASAPVRDAKSRHEPRKNPPRGYAQVRGGKETLSILIFNPFLEAPSEYKPWSGRAILEDAAYRHRPAFIFSVQLKLNTICAATN